MKILVLAWEFPPRIVGGIARHVAELYPEIVNLGHEIHLLTIEFGSTPKYELVEGIHLYRCHVERGHDFFHWVSNMNQSMTKKGQELLCSHNDFDLIHAHDWLVGDAAISLKHAFKIPILATIHATEYGRYNGIHNVKQRYIYDKEKLLAHEAWRIIVCSQYMRQEVQRVFQSPEDKVDVVYNGIRPEKKHHASGFDRQEFRRRFAEDTEKIIYYVGRMTYEKGISVLLNAAPQIIAAMEGKVKLFIIGGGNTDRLQFQADSLNIREKCHFTGFMSDDDLDKFQTIADCAVFPSLYEPFGIVALESFAARVPVVVSNTGGLPEVVTHNQTGIITRANDPHSLTEGILQVLQRPELCQDLVQNAYKSISERFSWDDLARQTVAVYGQITYERSQATW